VHYNRLKPFYGQSSIEQQPTDIDVICSPDSVDYNDDREISADFDAEYGPGKRLRRPVERLDL
jgi:hypothetical protein